MWRAQDPARSTRSRKNGARSATIKSRALGALKLASCARNARWECAREAGGFFFFFCQELTRRQNSSVFKNSIFQQFSRSAAFPPSFYKKIYVVKVVHHSILDKINKNQVNRCSRLQDLGAWKWPNFIKRGKLSTTVKTDNNILNRNS